MVDAHEQGLTLHMLCFYPEHSARARDPHYPFFNAAKRRLKAAGLLKCVLRSAQHSGVIELHHDKVEFALQHGVDLDKFNEFYGLHLVDEEAFLRFIEEEGNLEPLCTLHHRGILGVHSLGVPQWNALRVWKDDLEPPARRAA
jgi:hypothetical protein